ncbi:MAG: AAA family ATPase, partial [candidate division KSB1 bacterium]|nr:AAA family ATPase [candidate division KSB1 bacterium]
AREEYRVWKTLKRALKYKQFQIQSMDPYFMLTPSVLEPEPVPINAKVILIGSKDEYDNLYCQDDEFGLIFKIKADFDDVTDRTDASILKYASFIKKVCSDENLKAFDKTGVAAVIEQAVRIAGRQDKLTTQFSEIANLLREANYWAQQDNSPYVKEEHVEKALQEKWERLSLRAQKIQEDIREGTTLINTEGLAVGQVNGLTIPEMADFTFGRPARITGRTSMGRSGIINIEREADLSGKMHTKGIHILNGYFRGKYAQDKSLNMSATICFEQFYRIDGDSASSAEVYALISSLTELPIRQDLAVTGSVNQMGEIQPIGAVNEKIEGFYDVCRIRGLTGTQGVLIPYLNLKDLQLRKDVIQSVEKGEFHIYAIKTIDEGIEILTGVAAGEKQEDGTYKEGTVNFLVNKRLREMNKGDKGSDGD